MKCRILSYVIIAIVIFIPSEIWAEDVDQWDKLRSWKEVKDNKIQVLILSDAVISERQINIVEDAINSKKVNSERTLFFG